MNFSDIQARLNIGVLRADLQPFYGEFVNEALMEIQNRRSWTFMKTQQTITIPGGSGFESVVLVSGYKELRRAPSVFWLSTDQCSIGSTGVPSPVLVPADVVFEAQEIAREWLWLGVPPIVWPTRIFVNKTPQGGRIGTTFPLLEPEQVVVLYYQYLPPLVNPTDTSPFIDTYPQMVLTKARAIALSEINDAESQKSETLFELRLRDAIRQDAFSEVAGHNLHMGQGAITA
jgi:hypothetical protein